MLFSAVSVLVVVQSSSEIPEGLMNNPVYYCIKNPPRDALFERNVNILRTFVLMRQFFVSVVCFFTSTL